MIRFFPYLLPLTLKSSVAYIEFKWHARKAGKAFVRILENSGIDHEVAKEFADLYLSPSRMLGTVLRRA